MVMLCPSTIPQLKRFATAPATWAAATEVPVRVVMGTAAVPAEPVPRPAAVPAEPIPRPTTGPEILTPGSDIRFNQPAHCITAAGMDINTVN